MLYDYAMKCINAGLAVVPPREDGSKAPSGKTWEQYQIDLPSVDQITKWYKNTTRSGIGFVTGKVSGYLEVIDFDSAEHFPQFCDWLKDYSGQELLDKITINGCVESSPRGVHIYYYCPTVGPNTKLAADANGKCLIETRGEGGYIVAAPSSGKVNPAGQYAFMKGDHLNIPLLTPQEREDVLSVAGFFDCERTAKIKPCSAMDTKKKTAHSSNLRPGDVYNERASWRELIESSGWQFLFEANDTVFLRKPGSASRTHHATLNHQGSDLFYCFSSSAHPFEQETSYSKFAFYTMITHNGDFEAAAAELGTLGYGTPLEQQKTDVPWQNNNNQPINSYSNLIYDFCDLAGMELPEPKMFTKFLPEGLTVLAGAPKIGKSWFCLGLCTAAISQGKRKVFEYFDIDPVQCLYLALEDGERRIKKRSATVMLPTLQFSKHVQAEPGWLRIAHSWPKMTAGGLDMLNEYLEVNPLCRIVIIDTLAKIKAGGSKGKNAYENDYDIISEIKKLSDKYHAAIILITHLNKSHGDYNDILEEITGSMGISGAADTIIVLKRPRGKEKGADAEFHVTGRDIEEQTYSLQFNEGLWTYQGDLSTFQLTKKQGYVVDALKNFGREAYPKEIGKWIEDNHNDKIGSIAHMVLEMFEEGKIKKNSKGYFI